MSNILYIAEIAVALGLIIFVHELGHFLAAKGFGVWVRKFAIGFGPALVKWTRGETEYSLRAFPLGGFVEPMGEHPDSEGGDDPRALWRLPAWKRAIVFAAGVTMNAVLAFVLFVLAPVVGMQVPVPIVGDVMPDMPADKAGILPGDRIVSINGEKVESFEDLRLTVGLTGTGSSFDLVIERTGDGDAAPVQLTKTVKSVYTPAFPAPMLGIAPESSTVIRKIHPGAPALQTDLAEGDRILSVNGNAVETWRGLEQALEDAPAGPVVLAIERDGATQDLKIDPGELNVYDYGMTYPTEITGVEKDSPAEAAGIEAGDRVATIDDKRWPTSAEIIEAVTAAGTDRDIRFALWRNGRLLDLACKAVKQEGIDKPRVGVTMQPAIGEPVQVGHVDPGGPADKAAIRSGDVILRAGPDGDEPGDWADLTEVLMNAGGKTVVLQVERGASRVTTHIQATAEPQQRLSLAAVTARPLYMPLPRIQNPLVAAKRGVKRTIMTFGRVYANVRQLVTGEVGSKAIAGPVGIVTWSFNIASYGLGTFMDFWGMLSVCVAVLNFLPLPPFDGGHVLFVILEKIKGSPFSMRLRVAVWITGWVGVGALFLLLTYQDVVRWWLH